MTVASETSRLSFSGNGVTTAFAVSFAYRASADLVVTLRDAAGAETAQVETTNWTLVGVSDAGTGGFSSGTLTMLVAPATGTTLVISRKPALTQGLDATASGALTAANLEGALDRLTMLVQSMQEQFSRALLLKKSTTTITPVLPDPVASQILGWNAGGTDLVNYAPSAINASAVVTAFVLTLLDDTTAAAFLATLGLLKGSATIDFASATDNTTVTGGTTITVTGAVQGDFVILSSNGNIMTTAGALLYGKVTSANTITAYLANDSGGSFDAASQVVNALVIPKSLFGL